MSWLSQPLIRSISLTIAGSGIALWITSYFYLGRSFGVLPQKPRSVVKSGPYKYFSHPMYLGIFLTFTGLGLAVLSLPGFLVNLFILTPINYLRARRESRLLSTPGVQMVDTLRFFPT